jgi:hypothetical protein
MSTNTNIQYNNRNSSFIGTSFDLVYPSNENRPPIISISDNSDFITIDSVVMEQHNPSPFSELDVSYHPKNRQEVCKVKSVVGSIKDPGESLDRYVEGKSLSKGQQLELDRWFKSSQIQDFRYINLIQSSSVYRHMCISDSVEHISHPKVSCKPNDCHMNSLNVIDDNPYEYTLVQGFVYHSYDDGTSSVFTHSWNMNPSGKYYDFTPFTNSSRIVDEFYVGIQIPVDRWMKLCHVLHEIYLPPYIKVSPKSNEEGRS